MVAYNVAQRRRVVRGDEEPDRSIWCGLQPYRTNHANCPYDGMREEGSLGCACHCHNVPAHIRARMVPGA